MITWLKPESIKHVFLLYKFTVSMNLMHSIFVAEYFKFFPFISNMLQIFTLFKKCLELVGNMALWITFSFTYNGLQIDK